MDFAVEYINEEKGVHSAEEALAGARDIVAEVVADDAEIRKIIRKKTLKTGILYSEARQGADVAEFEMYKEFSEPVKKIPPHRILAINRGERENVLRVSVEVAETEMVAKIRGVHITNEKSIFTEELQKAVNDAYHRLIAPAIEREVRKLLTERADEHAILIFARNLRALLLTPPLKDKTILGIDPGFRTGCKVALVDATGRLLATGTIYPHEPQKARQKSLDQVH